MTEIDVYRPGTAEVDSWATVMPDVVRLSEHIAMTEFVPKGLRGRPAAVAAAVLAGREQGIGPMTALTHMHVVEGKPTMSAELKRARVFAAGHDLVYAETTTTRCVVRGRRRGQDEWTTVTWSMDDAKRAKLSGKAVWQNYPRRMLQARATSELCNLLFPDVVGGLPTTEDTQDDEANADAAGPAAPVVEEKPKRRTAQRRPRAKATTEEKAAAAAPVPPAEAPQPPLPGEDGYDESPAPPPVEETPDAEPPADPVTPPQLTKIATSFNEIGWTDRNDKLRAASTIVGRPLESSKDLTKGEARTLIDTLDMVAKSAEPAEQLGELLATVRESEERQGWEDVVDAEIVDPDEEAAAQAAAEDGATR